MATSAFETGVTACAEELGQGPWLAGWPFNEVALLLGLRPSHVRQPTRVTQACDCGALRMVVFCLEN